MFRSTVQDYDPVLAWLENHPNSVQALQHSVQFVFDGSPVLICSSSADVIAYLSRQIADYYPNESPSGDGERGCCIEIYLIDRKRDRRIILPVGEGAMMNRAQDFPSPESMIRSDTLIHMRWGEVEGVWRPFDFLASLRFTRPAQVKLLIARPASRRDEPATRRGVLRAKVATPGDRAIPRDEIADQVRTMIVRALGHLCLHAATVSWGNRGALLMGPSGSGKTTTALALMRGGFEMHSDEHTLLHGFTEQIQVAGFRSAPRIVGRSQRTLAKLEQSLGSRARGKTPLLLAHGVAPVKWIHPAAMFFLNVRKGTREHAVDPLPIEEAFVRVTNQVLDPTNVLRLDNQARAIIRFVEKCPAYELQLGDNLASIPELLRVILEALP
jgi:hypothetical protein